MPRTSPAQKLDRMVKFADAWQKHAQASRFYGLALADFRQMMQRSLDARSEIRDLQQRLRVAMLRRHRSDTHCLQSISRIRFSVLGDPAFGENSDLYEGMGFTREVERVAKIRRTKRRKRRIVKPA